MARSKKNSPEVQQEEIAPEVAEVITQNQNTVATLQGAYGEERDLVNQLLGQAQMADAISQFSRTVRLSKLAFVKENKLYKALAGKAAPNGSALTGSWEEFCELLGYSKDKVDTDLLNLREFGEEALDSMSRMGIGYRELRDFRRLPDDEKSALIEVAKSGDKDALVDFAESIFEKHTKEKAVLTKQVDDLTQEISAKEDVAKTNAQRINELQEKVARIKKETPDETLEALRKEAGQLAIATELVIRSNLRKAVQALREYEHESGVEQGPFIAGLFGMSKRALAEVQAEYDISETTSADDLPAWLREDADAALDAALAESQQ